jgi:hypothetical protein
MSLRDFAHICQATLRDNSENRLQIQQREPTISRKEGTSQSEKRAT